MKKVLKGLLFAFVGVFTLVALASCGGHTHKAKEGWKRDSAQHWHECEGCDEMLDAAAHTYGSWVVDAEADHANNKDGSRHKDCTVCGFRMKEAIKAMPVLYVRGGINGWGAPDEYKLTINTEDGSESIKGVVFAVNDEWKIADASWSDSANFGASNLDESAKAYFEDKGGNIKCNVAGTYTITVVNVLSGAKIIVEKTA
ncbi:MAG: hypothetical protein K2N42_05480 [Anaeroplasmataceae bacterium]|nr:hypothetical protein [Anaeroplasmataceae bacterium]